MTTEGTYLTEHLSSDQLLKYHSHLLSPDEEKKIRNHLEGCELCSDALNGISEMNNAMGIYNIVHELRKKMIRKHVPQKKILYRFELITILIAFFVIALVLVLGYYFVVVRK